MVTGRPYPPPSMLRTSSSRLVVPVTLGVALVAIPTVFTVFPGWSHHVRHRRGDGYSQRRQRRGWGADSHRAQCRRLLRRGRGRGFAQPRRRERMARTGGTTLDVADRRRGDVMASV